MSVVVLCFDNVIEDRQLYSGLDTSAIEKNSVRSPLGSES